MIRSLSLRPPPRTAAEWFAARRECADERFERLFRDWLAQDPAHGDDYALCEITWEVSRAAAHDLAGATLSGHTRAAGRRAAPRRFAVLVLAAGIAAAAMWFRPTPTLDFATAPGELRTVRLEDGSSVTLNTRTHLEVRLERHAREIVLEGGEAFFDVSKDASRPFTVRTALGSARAVGTHFNVYVDDHRLSVTTEEGRVLVETTRAGPGVFVDTGRHAELRPGMPRAQVEAANLAVDLGWMSRVLEVNDAPLGEVLAEFSRYTRLPLRAGTPKIAALRVSAVLRTGDLDALQATLNGAFGLSIEAHEGEYVVQSAHYLLPQ